MKKLLVLLLVIILCNGMVSAQEWKSKYDQTADFSEGMAIVVKDKKYGFVDNSGSLVIDLKFDYASYFSEGMAVVGINKKVGFIDKTGKLVVPMIYEIAGDFKEGFAAVQQNGKTGYISKEGRLVIPAVYDSHYEFSYGLVLVMKDGMYGFIDKSGTEIIEPEYVYAESFSNSLALVVKGNLFGFINKEGKTSIPFRYKNASSFHSNGLSRVVANRESEFGSYDDYWFINKNGDNVFSKKYTYATPFMEKFALVKYLSSSTLNEEIFFINSNGEQVNNEKYDYLAYTDFSRGLFAVRKDKQYFFVDQNGKDVSKYKFQDIEHIGNRFLKIQVNNKYGVFDKDYALFLDLKYDDISTRTSPLSKNKQQQIWYKQDNKWGIVTMDGSYNSGARYDNAPWTNNDDVVIANGKYGMLDSTGKEFVKPVYEKFDRSYKDNTGSYLRKIFRVCANNKCGYMDSEGKIVVPLEYEEAALDPGQPGLFESLTAVKKNGKWGFVDVANGRIVIPCDYDSYGHGYNLRDRSHIPYFKSKGGYVILKKGEMAGALDKNGTIIIPFEYESLSTYGAEDNEIIGRKLVDGVAYSFHYSFTGKFLKRKKM